MQRGHLTTATLRTKGLTATTMKWHWWWRWQRQRWRPQLWRLRTPWQERERERETDRQTYPKLRSALNRLKWNALIFLRSAMKVETSEGNLWTSSIIGSIDEWGAIFSGKIKEDNSKATCQSDARRSVLSSRSVSEKDTMSEREREKKREGER